jgi:hypothetical protein
MRNSGSLPGAAAEPGIGSAAQVRHGGRLRRILESAVRPLQTKRGRPPLSALTVLNENSDPYRHDTAAGHRDGTWFADQVAALAPADRPFHLRGLHYRIVASGGVLKPDGKPYVNTDECWEWLVNQASNAARWLEYVRFERIKDERNAPPTIFVPEYTEPRFGLAGGLEAHVPFLDSCLPSFEANDVVPLQPYRICFIGEKSSLGDVLLLIASRIGAELLLPSGEATLTQIAELAARAATDTRPCVVLYLSDFDPAGWQMPVSVARKLQALRDLRYPDLDLQCHVIGLTIDHVHEFDLPSTPLKETERRADSWRDVWGVEQTEIDALAALRPDDLRRIVLKAIAPFYDRTLARRTEAARAEWRQRAADMLAQHPDYQAAPDAITAARDEALASADALRKTQRDAFDQLDSWKPPEFQIPTAEIEQAPPRPLFSTDETAKPSSGKGAGHECLSQSPARGYR